MVTKMMVIMMKEIVVVMVIMMTVCNNIKKCIKITQFLITEVLHDEY